MSEQTTNSIGNYQRRRFVAAGVGVSSLVLLLTCSLAWAVEFPTAKDITVKGRQVPTPKETFSLEQLKQLTAREGGGSYPSDMVSTPLMPIAIRQEHPDGPSYHEAISYTFLVHSMKFPGVVRLDSGRLVLVATAWLKNPSSSNTTEAANRGVLITHSDDDGQSWSPPKVIHWGHERPEPIHLGGNKLALIPRDDSGFVCFSEDGGETWGKKIPLPNLPDGSNRVAYRHGTPLVEGSTITSVFYTEGPARGEQGWAGYSLLRRSRDGGRTWPEVIWLPPEWLTSEGAVTRAKDGALVVALRTAQAPGLPSHFDGWRRITTARSMDNGLTWTDHQVHFRYGKVHNKLLTLSNGDILMTYATRLGELDGQMYHGIEAVLSHDNGKTWDWDNRFILFRWAMHPSMHTPDSIELRDGRILTLFCYHYDCPWKDGHLDATGYPYGFTSAVIWSPYPEGKK